MRRKPAELRKSDIVEAVLVLADRIGPDRLTTNDVARMVGITQAAIFRHFPSKSDMWAAVGETLSDRMTTVWAEALAQGQGDPARRLRALIAAQFGQIERWPAVPAILHSRELAVSNGPLRDTCNTIMLTFRAHLADCLTRMKADRALRPDLSPQDGAMLLIFLVQGLAIRWTLGARTFPLVEEGSRMLEVQLGLFAGPDSGDPAIDTPQAKP
ncbi:MAG: TetR/AcrR family transcriptional regulator [Paracoccus sp. (in: a-proteobacteria)]|nr:TetR/AcrR family transcriptional regulator [Paracoccus sp. (in: a-proteobacteria)]